MTNKEKELFYRLLWEHLENEIAGFRSGSSIAKHEGECVETLFDFKTADEILNYYGYDFDYFGNDESRAYLKKLYAQVNEEKDRFKEYKINNYLLELLQTEHDGIDRNGDIQTAIRYVTYSQKVCETTEEIIFWDMNLWEHSKNFIDKSLNYLGFYISDKSSDYDNYVWAYLKKK